MEDPSDKVVIMVMMKGFHPDPLFDSLSKSVPETLLALQSKGDIATDELAETKHRRREKDDHKSKEHDSWLMNYRGELKSKRFERDAKRRINERRPQTPLCWTD